MSNDNELFDAITGQRGADSLGIPLGQQNAVGDLLRQRADVNRGISTRNILSNVIADAEGTTKFPDSYAVGFGGAKIDTNAPHPGVVGKYRGKPVSAAGRYQFTLDTWKDAHGGKNVPMTKENQEKALDYLLRIRHKVSDTELANGDFGGILPRLGTTWAALPSSKADQPKRDNTFIVDAMRRHGADDNMIKSLDSIVTGIKNGRPKVSEAEILRAADPRPDEVKQRTQLLAAEDAARMESEKVQQAQSRAIDIDAMIADALHGKNKLVDTPDNLPTQWDDQLMRIIKAV